jgi:hypothetical protein
VNSLGSFRSAKILRCRDSTAGFRLRWNRALIKENLEMKKQRTALLLLAVAILAGLPMKAHAQSVVASEDSANLAAIDAPVPVEPGYTRPTGKMRLHNYAFDAFGPYPIVGAALVAGIERDPPEWKQGAQGYAQRFGSDFAIAAISTSTRYALADAFKQDTLYYRCECKGFWPRLRHAVTSTVTARQGEDGHSVFSFPALVSPYAGTMAAVYGWYPNRFGAKDAFRMGNYNLLGFMGGNIALEFLYSGPHSLLSRWHLNNRRVAPMPVQAGE